MSRWDRVRRFARPIALFGVVGPVAVLAVLTAGARVASVAFGDLLFGLTVLLALGWTLVGVSGRRLAAARPSGELHRGAASDYGREVSQGSFVRLATPFRLLFVLTGTVVLGWLVVVLR